MEQTLIKADASSRQGTIRRLNGVCNTAPLFGTDHKGGGATADLIKALKIPMTRFHDATLENRGLQLVDVSRVFPVWTADVNDPENYLFGETDDYIAGCLETGSRIEYRLGESIEYAPKKYRVNPPPDYERWADICINIVRHYNEGWADGFRHNIEYWSVWEEPNTVPRLWTGTIKDYCEMYLVASRKLKKTFPHLKIGGPNIGFVEESMEKFLAFCREHDAPLDFCSFTAYTRDPENFLLWSKRLEERLAKYGFEKSEIVLSEWHYGPLSWPALLEEPEQAEQRYEELNGMNSAACNAHTLCMLQDSPVSMAYYYSMTSRAFGLFRRPGVPNKNYYAIRAFAETADTRERISVTPHPSPSVRAIGGRNGDGSLTILVSCFKSGAMTIDMDTGEFVWNDFSVRLIDESHELSEDHSLIQKNENVLQIRKDRAGSAVYLVRLY